MPRSGELRNHITIERQQSWLDQWGRQTGWRPVATVWASVVAASGRESFDGATKGVNASTAYTVRMRYRPDIDSACRLSYRGQTFDVSGVIDPDGRRRELVLTCVVHGSEKEAAA